MTPTLSVRNLRVEIPTRHGVLTAIDDLSFDIAPGEVLGVVGESGAGKSITGAAIIGLLEPPGHVAGGEIRLNGERVDNLPRAEMRRLRGKRIGMIFQDPLTSLDPLYRIGEQLVETVLTHEQVSPKAARVIGVHPVAIMFRHVLPNVTGPVLVIATLQLALAIITEATLSFLGLGVPATQPSLGTLIRIGNNFLFSGEWWIAIFPGATLAILALAVNLLGDWLRDALNPKLR